MDNLGLDTPSDCIACLLQLPASFFAYRKQQHRWTCGPVQLWRKAAVDIWASSLPMISKLDLILCYFGIRKFATHWVSLGFFCTIVPLSVFTPEVRAKLCCACNCSSLLRACLMLTHLIRLPIPSEEKEQLRLCP